MFSKILLFLSQPLIAFSNVMQLKYGTSRILSSIRLCTYNQGVTLLLLDRTYIYPSGQLIELNDHAIHKDLVSETELDYNTGNEKVKLISSNTHLS